MHVLLLLLLLIEVGVSYCHYTHVAHARSIQPSARKGEGKKKKKKKKKRRKEKKEKKEEEESLFFFSVGTARAGALTIFVVQRPILKI